MTVPTKEDLLAQALSAGGQQHLKGSDFNNVVVRNVDTEFAQGSGGLRVEFDISHQAIGKGKVGVLLSKLANLCGVKQIDGETGRTIKPGEMLD